MVAGFIIFARGVVEGGEAEGLAEFMEAVYKNRRWDDCEEHGVRTVPECSAPSAFPPSTPPNRSTPPQQSLLLV